VTDDTPPERAIELALPPEARARIEAMVAEPTGGFLAMVKAAGLDPKRSFRGKVLRFDVGESDLRGFDFSGADLTRVNLSKAKLAGVTLDGARVRYGQPRFMVLSGHQSWVRSAIFSPDGKRVVTASDDSTARVWDAVTGEQIQSLAGHQDWVRSVAFSPDGRLILTASDDRSVRVWDIAAGKPVGRLSGHSDWVNSAVFSPDGSRILTASDDKSARVWDTLTGAMVVQLSGHRESVFDAAFSSDGRFIVTASYDGTAKVWDASAGEEVLHLLGHGLVVYRAAFSPDGKRIVTASVDSTARVWDAETGEEVLRLSGHKNAVRSCAFSPDGTRIVTASTDGTARIWDASTGSELVRLPGHAGEIFCAAFSPDGARVVTASDDRTARIWFLDAVRISVFVSSDGSAKRYEERLLSELKRHCASIGIEISYWHETDAAKQGDNLQAKANEALLESDIVLSFKGSSRPRRWLDVEIVMALSAETQHGRPRVMRVLTSAMAGASTSIPPSRIPLFHRPLDSKKAFAAFIAAILGDPAPGDDSGKGGAGKRGRRATKRAT